MHPGANMVPKTTNFRNSSQAAKTTPKGLRIYFQAFLNVLSSFKPFPAHLDDFCKKSIFRPRRLQFGQKYFFFPRRFWKIFTRAINLILLAFFKSCLKLYYKIKRFPAIRRFLYEKIDALMDEIGVFRADFRPFFEIPAKWPKPLRRVLESILRCFQT